MKRSVGVWEFFGFAVTSLLGTVFHFLYDWLGESIWVAPFCGVNESTWEHMKLLFFPMLLFALAQSFFFRGYREFWCVKLRGILLGILLIPILFYTYNGAVGKSPDWLNIAMFFIAAAVSFIYETKRLNAGMTVCRYPPIALFTLTVIAVLFVVFSFVTPKLGIFRDPLTGGYGIE